MNSLEFIGYGEEMSDILKHIEERFGQGPSKAKLQKEFFPDGTKKNRKYKSVHRMGRTKV